MEDNEVERSHYGGQLLKAVIALLLLVGAGAWILGKWPTRHASTAIVIGQAAGNGFISEEIKNTAIGMASKARRVGATRYHAFLTFKRDDKYFGDEDKVDFVWYKDNPDEMKLEFESYRRSNESRIFHKETQTVYLTPQ